MEESLSFVVTFEGGQPSVQLVVLEGYRHPNRILEIPLGLLDFRALVRSVQATGDYWIVNATPDLPEFQVESAVFVRHRDGKILWDIVYEHYEPFLHVELDVDEDEPADAFDENIITLTFDPFQYVSAMYQFCQLYPKFRPITFQAKTSEESLQLEAFLPQLHILWRRFGEDHGAVNSDGLLVGEIDTFSRQAEEQWTDDIIRAVMESRLGSVISNIDTYLDSLPPEVVARLEADGVGNALNERWNKLFNSLTDEEKADLENEQSKSKFPNSLKLRLMREFLSGNPSVLLGHSHTLDPKTESPDKVVSLESWKKDRLHEHGSGQ